MKTVKNATNDYLDMIATANRDRQSNEPATDYRVAQILGIVPSAVYRYRTGVGGFDNATCWRVAEVLKDHGVKDVREVIIAIERDRTKDDDMKKVWEGRLAQIGGKAAVLVCSVMLLGGQAGEARAATLSDAQLNFQKYTFSFIARLRRWWNFITFEVAPALALA